MADRMPVWIEIGGTISEEQVDVLEDIVEAEGMSWEWGSYEFDADYIREAAHDNNPLQLFADEKAWGRCEELEAWCREQGLTYFRHTSAKYEWNAEVSWWKPGLEKPFEVPANEAAEVVFTLEEVSKAHAENRIGELIEFYTPPKVPALVIEEVK